MLSAASSVLVGVTPADVAAPKSDEQDVPAVLTQELSAFASVFSLRIGKVTEAGTAVPGAVPLLVLTRSFAVWKALTRLATFVQLEPTLPPLVINGANAQTDAVVVSSLTMYVPAELILPQLPRAVISQSDELAEPALGEPPFESK